MDTDTAQTKIDAIAEKIGYKRENEQSTKYLPPDEFKPVLYIRQSWRDKAKLEISAYSPYFDRKRYCEIYAALARPLEQLAADIRRRAVEKFLEDVKNDRRRETEKNVKEAQQRETLREIFDAYGDAGKFCLNYAHEPTSLDRRFSIKCITPGYYRLEMDVNSKYAALQIIKILAADAKQQQKI
ncbi:MAG: hypothetical protein J6P03_06060 [Opitutales bacterium]|nr:hypothetical protein [Opitutales bacterium]